jgi:transposase
VSISQEALFKIALNLEDPWYIKTIDFSAEGKQLDIHVDFEPGSKFPCAKCGNPGCIVHDTIENSEKPNLIDNYKYYCHYIIVHEKPH